MGTQIAELMTLRAVADKVNPGGGAGVWGHSVRVDLLLRPQAQQAQPERIGADAGQVSRARTGTGGGDDGIAGVAAKTLLVVRLACAGLVEFDHGFAQGQHVP